MNASINKLKRNRHPINYIEGIVGGRNITLNFSEYSYHPQTLEDVRTTFPVNVSNLNFEWLENELLSLGSDQELALHSNVLYNGKKLHLPMIDFTIKRNETNALAVMKELASFWKMDFYIFFSGKSFHAYGSKLVSNKKWLEFMGSLLLLNIPGKTNNIIDTRWVGHRVLAGYSALRWSNNTSSYKQYPTYVGRISENVDLNSDEVLFS